MSEGISLKELYRFFDYLEYAIKNDKTTVVIDNAMCKFLYKYLKEISKEKNEKD